MKRLYLIFLMVPAFVFNSCEDFLEAEVDNRLSYEQIIADPSLAEGILLNAYSAMPGNTFNFFEDIASDDAVTNDKISAITRMATGEWQSSFDPVSKWDYAYQNLYYINYFLEIIDTVEWSWHSKRVDSLHFARLNGEAHALRAWYNMQLLQNHAGYSNDGILLGFPIVTSSFSYKDDLSLPRNTFSECYVHIKSDLDTAIKYLPDEYKDTFRDLEYDEAMGGHWMNRINSVIAWGLKARLTLMAASPAYSEDSGVTWEEAAEVSGSLIKELGRLEAFSETGLDFYLRNSIRDISNEKEILWLGKMGESVGLETNNFPPSHFGSGRINPSQNLVEAFPMKNGYPIGNPLSQFDENKPYLNRDPRLGKYIVYNESTFKTPIYTYSSAEKDGINELVSSTRTGYYLKKFLNPNVALSPVQISKIHYNTYLRLTEIFLIYAEAANEAWGPDDDPLGFAFNARDIMEVIRDRAGIDQPDEYLEGIVGKDQMRNFIRNERRLELCFEGFRFWDIRRWKLTGKMNEPVMGVFIEKSDSVYSYSYEVVEPRIYQSHMIYGPIPYEETLKYDIIQNQGWQ